MSAPQPDDARPLRKKPRWRRWLVEIGIFIVVFAAFQAWQLRDTARGPAPAIHGQLLDNRLFSLADWRASQPDQAHLLYFWAEWCPVCKTTAGSVTNIAADWPVTTLASQSGPPDAVRQVMADRGYTWPTVADPTGQAMRDYRLPGVPAFVVIDRNGQIRFVAVGYTSEIGLRLRLWWANRTAAA
ncbi:MAG: protein disulfide oxidoreductase [Dechloromonas sp.]|nr:protein disulfide oxidoreductase [Dechloromonas sp.]